ncbi:MAG: hypothetical protein QMD32_04395 [Smithellaceae bacterium]|nr:hypothetical protein [Smithellaceae bacterium]
MSQIVSDIVSCENQIHQFFLNQKIGSLLKRSNIDKEKGISPVSVFRVLVTMVFTGKNLFRTIEAGGSCGMAKDTVYRFLNSVHSNWRRFLLLLSSRVISQELESRALNNRCFRQYSVLRLIFWKLFKKSVG